MRFNYAPAYTPPAPIVELWLGVPEMTPAIGPLVALIDTGADGTLVPAHYLRAISSLAPVDRKWLRSQWGEPRLVRLYLVDIELAGVRLPDIEVVADPVGNEVVLGRNVLNRLRIVLDGPKKVIDIHG
jgi:predicted aspartyl protease